MKSNKINMNEHYRQSRILLLEYDELELKAFFFYIKSP